MLVDLEATQLARLGQLAQGRIGGRYLVERLLGEGGMGLVAAARYPELDQEVAIKFMRPELAADKTLSARFLREARLAARAKSPHFVRVFDFGKLDSGVPYLVMEMLTGRDLGDELKERGPLPVEAAIDYVLQAAVGLAEIHALGVVHRDLKPSNLFVAEAAGTRTLKVLDLGLSTEGHSAAGKGLTTTGHTFGTPHYMSPEQIKESKTVDARSDIWALGVILYELLTGALPIGHESESTGEVFGLILHTDPVPVRERRADVPEALAKVIMRCLRREPSERYADLAEFADALRPFAGAAASSRPDAVRAALATHRSDVVREVVVADSNPPREPISVSAPTIKPPTTPAGPVALRGERPRAATGLAHEGEPASGAPPVQAASGNTQQLRRRPPWVVPATLGALVVGLVSPFLVMRLVAGSPAAPAASVSSTPTQPAVTSSAEPAAATAASTSDVPATTSTASAAAAAISNAPAPPAVPAFAAPGRPRAPAAGGHPSAPAARKPAPTGASVLDGLDRK